MNEGSFDICWKCGGEREDVEAERPRAENGGGLPLPLRSEDFLNRHVIKKDYDASPYAPPVGDLTLPEDPESADPELREAQLEYEDTVERAYRASVIGMVTIPWLFHIYSVVLLLHALGLPAKSTRKLKFRFRAAMAINLAAFAVAGYFIYYRTTHYR